MLTRCSVNVFFSFFLFLIAYIFTAWLWMLSRLTPVDFRGSAAGMMLILFKNGGPRVCSNYRSITLLSLPGRKEGQTSDLDAGPVLAVEHWTITGVV